MTTLHEQARAEAEKRYDSHAYDLRASFVGGFLAGHEAATKREQHRQDCIDAMDEAATRTRVVTTVTELDALPVGSVVLLGSGQVFARVGMDRTDWQAVGDGDYWHPRMILAEHPDAPARVLYEPEETR